MKYAVLVDDETFEIREGDINVNGTPIIKVTHVGVCGTDMSYWKLGSHYPGQIIGHEYSGIIVDPGQNPNLKEGDRVVGYTQNVKDEFCGHCANCLEGKFDECTNSKVLTWKGGELNHPGAFSELTTWFNNSLWKLPDNVSNEAGALIEPFAVGLRAVYLTGLQPNDKVLILGGGIIGLAVAEWARSYGAGMIAMTEVHPDKISTIKGFKSADYVLKGDDVDLADQFKEVSDGGFDVVFDCVGIQSAIKAGMEAFPSDTRARKIFTSLALPHKGIEIDYDYYVLKEIVMKGSKGHIPAEFETVMKCVGAGKIDLEKYVTKRIPLIDVQKGFEELKASGGTPGKAVVVM